MQSLTAIIIDDEKPQQDLLCDLLREHFKYVELLAICNSAEKGLEAIAAYSPDVVFLDVEMPGKSGFDLLRSLPKIDFEVIFTTAHSKYAVDAFRFAAIDFLLKPVLPELVADALTRVLLRLKEKSDNSGIAKLQNLLDNLNQQESIEKKIALPTSNGLLFVRLADVVRCEVHGNFTIFHLTDRSQQVVSRTMKECEETLGQPHFFRIHQSHLVNLNRLKRYIKGEGGEVEMEDGLRLPVSRRQKEDFLQALSRV